MRQVFGALAALAIGWGLCAPAHAQELFPLQAVSGGGSGGCSKTDSGFGASLGLTCDATVSDDFNETSIDTTKWQVVGDTGYGTACTNPPANVSGGELQIPSGEGNGCAGYVSANNNQLFAKTSTGDDYTELTIRVDHPGTKASYYTFGQGPGTGFIPEIDLDNTCISATNHVGMQNNTLGWSYPDFANSINGSNDVTCQDVTSLNDTGTHTIGLYRKFSDQTLNFYADGVLINTITAPLQGQYGASSGQSLFLTQNQHPVFLMCSGGCGVGFYSDTESTFFGYIHYYH